MPDLGEQASPFDGKRHLVGKSQSLEPFKKKMLSGWC